MSTLKTQEDLAIEILLASAQAAAELGGSWYVGSSSKARKATTPGHWVAIASDEDGEHRLELYHIVNMDIFALLHQNTLDSDPTKNGLDACLHLLTSLYHVATMPAPMFEG